MSNHPGNELGRGSLIALLLHRLWPALAIGLALLCLFGAAVVGSVAR